MHHMCATMLLLLLPCVSSFHFGLRSLNNKPFVRPSNVKLLVAEPLAEQMLSLMDKWAIEDEISKPYPEDDAAEACMVPIELEWLNARICELEECPLDLPEAFASAWERVKFKGEGCVTFNALKEEVQQSTS